MVAIYGPIINNVCCRNIVHDKKSIQVYMFQCIYSLMGDKLIIHESFVFKCLQSGM